MKVDIFNYQQQLLGTVSTNGDGMAGASLRSKPFIVVAQRDHEKAYLKLAEGNSVSLSMFDVSGEPVRAMIGVVGVDLAAEGSIGGTDRTVEQRPVRCTVKVQSIKYVQEAGGHAFRRPE